MISRHTITLGFAPAWCSLIPPDVLRSTRWARSMSTSMLSFSLMASLTFISAISQVSPKCVVQTHSRDDFNDSMRNSMHDSVNWDIWFMGWRETVDSSIYSNIWPMVVSNSYCSKWITVLCQWIIFDVNIRDISEFTQQGSKKKRAIRLCDRQTWRAITCLFCRDLHLTLMFSGLLQEYLFKGGGEIWRKLKFFKQDCCQACHTRFAAFFPLPSCFVSSLSSFYKRKKLTNCVPVGVSGQLAVQDVKFVSSTVFPRTPFVWGWAYKPSQITSTTSVASADEKTATQPIVSVTITLNCKVVSGFRWDVRPRGRGHFVEWEPIQLIRPSCVE